MFFTISSIVFLFIIIIVSNFIQDYNLKVAYWLMLFLLYVSYSNIYLSTYFYAELRENPGIQGERGESGEMGASGSDGMCVITPNCNIPKCDDFIESVIKERYLPYHEILKKIERGEESTLTKEEKKIKDNINIYKETLIPQCENSNMTVDQFRDVILETIDIS